MRFETVIIGVRGDAGATGPAGPAGVTVDTTLADLQSAASTINTTDKTRHKLAVDETERVYRALGPDPTDEWRPLDDPAGIEGIIPA